MNTPANRAFGTYERVGAYHWREIEPRPMRHNAVLTAQAQRVLKTGGQILLTTPRRQGLHEHTDLCASVRKA